MQYESNRPAEGRFSPNLLKAYARARMREGYPGGLRTVMVFTLVYLLLSDWLSQILNQLPTNPLTALSDQMMEALNTGTPAAINQVYLDAAGLFSPPAARVTLFLTILAGLFSVVLSYGYSSWAMELHRRKQPPLSTLFSRFHQAGRIILLTLLVSVCIYLWSLLFLIPGLIAYYRYRMSRYILLDNPQLSAFAAWQQSKRMMQGHKLELFLLDLSFLPWILLSLVCSYGAGYLLPAPLNIWGAMVFTTAVGLYLTPYMELATVGFYRLLKGNHTDL